MDNYYSHLQNSIKKNCETCFRKFTLFYLNHPDGIIFPPLYFTLKYKNAKFSQILIDEFKQNYYNYTGETFLKLAVYYEDYYYDISFINHLIDIGVDINEGAPLLIAALRRNKDTVKLLVSRGADPYILVYSGLRKDTIFNHSTREIQHIMLTHYCNLDVKYCDE